MHFYLLLNLQYNIHGTLQYGLMFVIFFEQFQFTLWEISSTALHFGAILNHIYIYIYSSILRWIQLSYRDKDDYFISLRSLEYLLKRGKRIGTILFELVMVVLLNTGFVFLLLAAFSLKLCFGEDSIRLSTPNTWLILEIES